MILSDKVCIKLGAKNISYYASIGYEIKYELDSRGRKRVVKEIPLLVDVKDLPMTTNVKVEVMCEVCNEKRKVQYGTLAGRKNSSYNKTGETLCSNCANSRMSGVNSGAYKHGNVFYPQYRNNAKKRGITFELSIAEFETLIPGNCFYCGEESNGIDRVDSNKGYLKENCVSCCSQCNFIKNNTPKDKFIKKIVSMYNTFKKNGLI